MPGGGRPAPLLTVVNGTLGSRQRHDDLAGRAGRKRSCRPGRLHDMAAVSAWPAGSESA